METHTVTLPKTKTSELSSRDSKGAENTFRIDHGEFQQWVAGSSASTLPEIETSELLVSESKAAENTSIIDRDGLRQQVAGSSASTLPKIDGSGLQKVFTAPSGLMPPPIEKLKVEDFVIVWLDANIGQNDNTRKTIAQLRRIANDIQTFIDRVACIEFISQIKNEQVFLIVSGALGQETVPAKKQFNLALEQYQLALDIESQAPHNQQGIASIYNNIANDLYAQGMYSDALYRHQQALDIRLKVLPSTHSLIAMSYGSIAECFY
ncbi:unnamed protein product, partial [Rotaria sordida]